MMKNIPSPEEIIAALEAMIPGLNDTQTGLAAIMLGRMRDFQELRQRRARANEFRLDATDINDELEDFWIWFDKGCPPCEPGKPVPELDFEYLDDAVLGPLVSPMKAMESIGIQIDRTIVR